MRQHTLGAALAGLVILAVAGCGSSSTATPTPASAATSVGSSAAPSAHPSVEPSVEAPSTAPSEAIPGFSFPSSDKELEALLPAELCGVKTRKLSMSGDLFMTDADPQFLAMLSKLGKTAADVSFAIAGPSTSSAKDCSAGIFRIKGADGGQFKEAFLAASTAAGNTYTQKSLGGKDVYVDAKSDSLQYAYFKGDALIFAGGATEQDAAEVLAQLP